MSDYPYIVNKYGGRTYCGNAFCKTFIECIKFADDGFCDKAVIKDERDGTKYTIKIERKELGKGFDN